MTINITIDVEGKPFTCAVVVSDAVIVSGRLDAGDVMGDLNNLIDSVKQAAMQHLNDVIKKLNEKEVK